MAQVEMALTVAQPDPDSKRAGGAAIRPSTWAILIEKLGRELNSSRCMGSGESALQGRSFHVSVDTYLGIMQSDVEAWEDYGRRDYKGGGNSGTSSRESVVPVGVSREDRMERAQSIWDIEVRFA